MNIRTTVAASLGLAMVILVVVVAVTLRWVLLDQYQRLETRQATVEMDALGAAVAVQAKELDQRVTDWSLWGSCHDWFLDPQPAFIEDLVTETWMDQSGIDLVALFDVRGHLQAGRTLEPDHQRIVTLDATWVPTLSTAPLLFTHQLDGQAAGIVTLGNQPWLLASRPSLNDAGKGPVRGTVLMGRRLGPTFLSAVVQGPDRIIAVRPMDGQFSATPSLTPLDDGILIATIPLPDPTGQAHWYLRSELPREIWQQGVHTNRLLLAVVVAVAFLVAVVAWWVLEKRVCARLSRLEHQVSGISTGQERVAQAGDDEVARLGAAFNRALDDLGEANVQLAASRDEAMAVTKAKADLLAAVSHELRTPLNGILGMIRLLGNAILDKESRELLEVMRTSGDNLLVLVNDILDVSRLEAGRMELESMVFDCRSVVEDALLLHAERAQSKGINLAAVVDSGLPRHVNGDPGRFRQIIHNLVGNAVKFTERGEVVVRLLPDPSLSSPGFIGLRLSVRDTGVGIPRAVQDRLFQRYTQADSSTTRRFGGSGLGLSICKQLAERMGGSIHLESDSISGSTLSVHLRLARVEVAPSTEPGAGHEDANRVLVIDPHAATREGLRHTLRSLSYVVEEAGTLDQARLLIQAGGGYAWVLAGTTVCDPAAKPDEIVTAVHTACGELPILLLTHLADRARFVGVKGLAAVLAKPIRRAHLRESLARLANPDPSRQGPIDPVDDDSGLRSGLRVLVIDDSQINQRVASGMLKRLGCHVDVAGNGLEGLEALRRRRYDLIVLDCQMPVMDGFVMAEQWRREEDRDRRVLMVALTADVTVGARDRCLSAGMDDYLVKPIDLDQLASTVRRAVSRRSDGSGKLPALYDLDRTRAAKGELDRVLLDQVRILGDDGFRNVIDRYIDSIPQRLNDLAQALDHNDAAKVGMIAHQMVGESGLVGLRRVEHLAREIELAARSDGRMLEAHLIPLREAFSRGSELLLVARDEPATGDA